MKCGKWYVGSPPKSVERAVRRAVDARRMGTVATAGVSVMVTVRGTDFKGK